VPWNDSCAGGLIAGFLGITPLGLCNNAAVTSTTGPLNVLLNAVGGSGGPSACATGSPAPQLPGVVSGTCAGYPKPAWQKGLYGNPNDGVRDIPDVSLFASNGFWGSYYVVCWSNPDTTVGGGFTCTGAPSAWAGFGGTSIPTPIMAGIQALINEKTGSRWGNPNTVLYSLANTEYAPVLTFTTYGTAVSVSGAAACNSNTVAKIGSTCIFYDITQGDNDVVCSAATGAAFPIDCYRPRGYLYGILSTSNSVPNPAYRTNLGWDFTSGIGSLNAWNLVMNWP
jgi:subtilase family serine protease